MGQPLPFGDMGPCELVFGYGESGEMVLKPYFGTISIKSAEDMKNIEEEAHGNAPVDAVSQGLVTDIDVPFTRLSVDEMEAMLAAERGSGDVLVITTRAGCPSLAYAKSLLVKPVCDNVADPDPSHWILFYKTFPYRKFEIPFDRATQRVLLIGFKVFSRTDAGYEGKQYQIGV